MDRVQFPGIKQPTVDFGSVRNQLSSIPRYQDIDLSTARSLSAGTALMLPIAGNTFYVDQKANGGYARMHFQDQNAGSTPVTVYPGFLARVPFTQIALENDAQAGVTMRIIYGVDIDFVPTSAAGVSLLNPVSVVDGALARTLANSSFAVTAWCAASAGTYSHVQLWNPGTATKQVIVTQLRMTCGAKVYYGIRPHTAALANLVSYGQPKLLGGTASAASARSENSAAGIGGSMLQYLKSTVADVEGDAAIGDPIVIPPGKGLIIQELTGNLSIYAHLQYYEY